MQPSGKSICLSGLDLGINNPVADSRFIANDMDCCAFKSVHCYASSIRSLVEWLHTGLKPLERDSIQRNL